MVERTPPRGAGGRGVPLSEAVEIPEVRAALEGLCAAKAATRLTDGDRDRLRAVGAAMRDAVDRGDLLGYARLNQQLHAMVRALSGQRTAELILDRLRGQNVHHQFRLALLPGRAAASLPEHLAIIEALCAGDPGAAEAAVHGHLRSVVAALPAVAPLHALGDHLGHLPGG